MAVRDQDELALAADERALAADEAVRHGLWQSDPLTRFLTEGQEEPTPRAQQSAHGTGTEPLSMEEAGLNPASLTDCEIYDDYLINMAEAENELDMAYEDAAVEVQFVADEVVFDAMERAAFAAVNEAERIMAEAHEAADAYLNERMPAARGRAVLARSPIIVRARMREPRTRRTTRRARVRSGSRGDPPDGDEGDEPPGVELAPGPSTGRRGVERAA